MFEMEGRRKTRRWLVAVAIVLVVLLFPLPLRDVDKQRIISDSAIRLINVEPVRQRLSPNGEPSGWNYIPFIDSDGIKQRNLTWHLVNGTDLDCALLHERGFRSLTGDEFRKATEEISWYSSNAALEITTRDPTDENGRPHLRFNYYYGWLGAQGFRIRAYRCILGTWYYFQHEWVS